MTLLSCISTVFVAVGIASDNLVLSAMGGSLAVAVKPGKLLLILFMLLSIQMQAFMYGSWMAKFLVNDVSGMGKWIALSILIATALRMYQESVATKNWKNDFPFGLNGFLGIALATSIYVFVLGFSLNALQIPYNHAYSISMATLAVMLVIGWYTGKANCLKTCSFIKKTSLVMMAAGILLFIIQ